MGKDFEVTAVKGREIIDCRGYPTVQVDAWVNNVVLGRPMVSIDRTTDFVFRAAFAFVPS